MRTRLSLAALGVATAFLVPAPAQAICVEPLYDAVGWCNPCDPVNAVLYRYGTHLDCVR